tara:strand:- start:209 stop:730 length:522 start_codon:yes stop_codon:yes gene_type:complete
MKHTRFNLVAVTAFILTFGGAPGSTFNLAVAQEVTSSNDWLLDAPDDHTRFQLLQRYLRGFDQPMWEVGHRYLGVYDALGRENYDLALYHWDKIKTTIQNGYLKRPARRANSEAVLLDTTWGEVRAAFESRDIKQAWDGFFRARNACMACHVAEDVAWMNDQDIFDDTASANN